jgi:hypothetical protein
MQTRRIRLQHCQLELFYPQSDVIHWHKLPDEIQQQTKTLLAKLLRECLETQLPRSSVKEGNHE